MHDEAIRHLSTADPVLGRVIECVAATPPGPQAQGEHFDHILRAIVYQQLAGAAAATIHRRFLALYGDRAPTSAELLATPDETLRSVGLSRQKISYMRDFASRVASGEVPLDALHQMDDAAVIESLTRVKGIGTWTAQMFLMFRLGRPDVLPVLDLGIRNAMQRAYRLRKMPTPERMHRIAESWSPHRTVACWYLWRWLDTPEGAAKPRRKPRIVKKAASKPTKVSKTTKPKAGPASAAKKRVAASASSGRARRRS